MAALDSLHSLLDYECLLSGLSSAVTDMVLIYESVTSLASVVRWLTLHSWTLNPTQLLKFWILLQLNYYSQINYMHSLYNFGTNKIETTISNSSRYCVLILFCGNVSSDPLPSNGCTSTVDSVTSGTCVTNRCLAMIICFTMYKYKRVQNKYTLRPANENTGQKQNVQTASTDKLWSAVTW
jgi:hypothetical protein